MEAPLTPKFDLVNGIKIYDDTTDESRHEHDLKLTHLRKLNECYPKLFNYLEPSTLVAQMNNISIMEARLEPKFDLVNGIKIYDGTTDESRHEHELKLKHLRKLNEGYPKLFTDLEPSTLTAQGKMTNISFMEDDIMSMLSAPPIHMLMIGCNYGEIFHPIYVRPIVKKTSGRGRKPKPKKETKRKVQGSGLYFSSQVTFVMEHADTHQVYKVKMFRNGVFQVPGVKDPKMLDLIKPIEILRKYLAYNFGEDVQVIDFMAVMRNYKARLIDENSHVHLAKLEELILRDKTNPKFEHFLDYMLQSISSSYATKIKARVGTFNPMNIAEMTYNTDRCVSLIIKFYRPNRLKPKKKTTVKLLKKGKINFDGGNSEQEVIELYHWLQFVYNKYSEKVIFDTRKITTGTDSDTSDCSDYSIYDDDSDDSDDSKQPTKTIRRKTMTITERVDGDMNLDNMIMLSLRTPAKNKTYK
jgi:hypothetical protein